jgi:hypothetical protein
MMRTNDARWGALLATLLAGCGNPAQLVDLMAATDLARPSPPSDFAAPDFASASLPDLATRDLLVSAPEDLAMTTPMDLSSSPMHDLATAPDFAATPDLTAPRVIPDLAIAPDLSTSTKPDLAMASCASRCPNGCCDANGVCQPASTTTCGINGAACVACALADGCTNGQCTCGNGPACDPQLADRCFLGACSCNFGPGCQPGQYCGFGSCNCDGNNCANGCCDANNICHVGSPMYCGINAQQCLSCAPGQECAGGACTCDAASCTGCCDLNNMCQPGNLTSACGAGGSFCDDCGGRICDPNSHVCKCASATDYYCPTNNNCVAACGTDCPGDGWSCVDTQLCDFDCTRCPGKVNCTYASFMGCVDDCTNCPLAPVDCGGVCIGQCAGLCGINPSTCRAVNGAERCVSSCFDPTVCQPPEMCF